MARLNQSYSDILKMPTGERRFHLGLLLKQKQEEDARVEQGRSQNTGKGTKTTRIGGDALKNKLKSGDLPN